MIVAALAAYLLGLGLGELFSSSMEISVLVALMAAGAAMGWKAGLPRASVIIVAALFCVGLAGGGGEGEPLPPEHLLYHLPDKPATLEGWVAEEPNPVRGALQVRVRSEWLGLGGSRQRVVGDCLVRLPKGTTLRYGQPVRLEGLSIGRPRGFANPGGFDYRRYLARQRIYVVGRLASEGSVRAKEGLHGEASKLKYLVSRWRVRMLGTMERNLAPRESSVLQAIILGARERLSLEVRTLFRNTGTAHLLAISGLHVGFIAVAVFWALRTLLRTALRLLPETLGVRFAPSRWAALGTAPAVLFYALLVGARVATVRAAVMVLVFLASRICRVASNNLHALALAALVILVGDPEAVGDVGFQLSFIAVAAILLALRWHKGEEVSLLPAGERTWAGRLKERTKLYLLISLVAFLATWPLIGRTFHRVALIGPLANALVFPLASLTIPAGLAAALSSLLLPGASRFLLAPAGWGASVLIATLRGLARLPFSNLEISAPSAWTLAVYYGLLGFLLLWPRARRRSLLAAGAALLIVGVTVASALHNLSAMGRLSVTALDAGRSQAILISLPDGRRLLWYGAPPRGRSSYSVRQVVVPALLHQRVSLIHGLIAANDTEETGKGLMSLARAVDIRELWLAGAKGKAAHLSQAARELELPVVSLSAGWSEPCGRTCVIRVLWPEAGGYSPPAEGYVTGPVLYLRHEQKGVLLTGDSSYRVERALLESVGSLEVSLMQVPKAGSRYASSRTFLKRVHPEAALLAARAPRSWQADVENTIARYGSLGIPLWNVERDGAFTWWSDGESSSVSAERLNEGGSRHPRPEGPSGRGRSR